MHSFGLVQCPCCSLQPGVHRAVEKEIRTSQINFFKLNNIQIISYLFIFYMIRCAYIIMNAGVSNFWPKSRKKNFSD